MIFPHRGRNYVTVSVTSTVLMTNIHSRSGALLFFVLNRNVKMFFGGFSDLFKSGIVNFGQFGVRFDMLWLDFWYIEGLVQKEIEE